MSLTKDITISDYGFNADYLASATGSEVVEETLVSHLLKSNCLITNQPDWGSVMIRYQGRVSIAKRCCAI